MKVWVVRWEDHYGNNGTYVFGNKEKANNIAEEMANKSLKEWARNLEESEDCLSISTEFDEKETNMEISHESMGIIERYDVFETEVIE